MPLLDVYYRQSRHVLVLLLGTVLHVALSSGLVLNLSRVNVLSSMSLLNLLATAKNLLSLMNWSRADSADGASADGVGPGRDCIPQCP